MAKGNGTRWGIVAPGMLAAGFLSLSGLVDTTTMPGGLFLPLLIASLIMVIVVGSFEKRWLLLICTGMVPTMVVPEENTLFTLYSFLPLIGIFHFAISSRSKQKGLGDFPPLLLLLLAGYLFVSILSSFFGATYLNNLFMVVLEGCLLIAVCKIFHVSEDRIRLLRDLLLALAAGALLVLVFSTFFSPWSGKKAPFPFFENANYFACLLAMLLPMPLWMATRKRGWERILWAVLAAAFLTAVLLFQSRGAWIGLAGGLVLGIFFYLRSLPQRLALLVTALTGGIGLWLVQPAEPVSDPGTALEKIRSIADTQGTFSNRERIVRWKCALRIWETEPLFGIGPHNYPREFKFYLEDWAEVEQISYWPGWEGQAHSEYLTRLSERGILGFVAFVGMLAFVLFRLWRLQQRRAWGRTWTAFVAASLGVWLVHGLVDDLSGDMAIWLAVALIMGAGARGIRQAEEEKPQEGGKPPKKKMKPKYMHNPNPVTNFSP